MEREKPVVAYCRVSILEQKRRGYGIEIQIREAIGEENRKDIIERLWKGRQERVRRGLPPGGNVPYSYQRNGKGLILDPAEAEIVGMIFELAGRGETCSGIPRALNGKGLARRNGKPWTQRQVAAILSRGQRYRESSVWYGESTGVDESLILIRSEPRP